MLTSEFAFRHHQRLKAERKMKDDQLEESESERAREQVVFRQNLLRLRHHAATCDQQVCSTR